MSDLPSPVFLNATVQYNLALTGNLDLLDVFENVLTVSTVIEELEYGVEEYGLDYLDRAIGAVEVVDDPDDLDMTEMPGLDPGETHALHHAIGFEGTLATDDSAARRRAAAAGVAVTGSLRVLTLAIEDDRLTVEQADAKLDRWINEGGYHSPIESITEVL